MAGSNQRRRLQICGLVQGVGFRPFLWRLARRHGLTGWVANEAAGVTVEIAGEAAAIEAFLREVREESPPLSRIDRITEQLITRREGASDGLFVIRPSEAVVASTVELPPDIAPCAACLAEMRDPTNRRFGYPFINCTDCGPRFTIITGLPYDRPRTTMARFPLCADCLREYTDPADRRFHAQPIACPACGPVVWFTAATDPAGLATTRPTNGLLGEDALRTARRQLREGRILAIKGIGGFQLLCDATNAEAVARLRRRKQRPRKPLAVMVRNRGAAAGLAVLTDQAARLLDGPTRPIVLLPIATAPTTRLATAVTPGAHFLGLMLPSSPLHERLLEDDIAFHAALPMPPLVVTSGNLADEPLIHDNAVAAARLASIADGFLMHDRPVQMACDDSVVRSVAGMPLPIRFARGLAPQTVQLADEGPCVLAVGGELKATLCLAHGRQAVVSQHLGDIASPESLDALTATARQLLALTGMRPAKVVADLHPGYLSTEWAREFAAKARLPLVQVQHHEAHAAALLAEHGLSLAAPTPTLVACFDGTGYGRDGTLQGSEFLLVHDGRLQRVAHLAGFPLPGGEAAIRQPWRIAAGLLATLGIDPATAWPAAQRPVPEGDMRVVAQQAVRGIACPTTSSMGRLFDAAASLTGLCHEVSFEAEAAMQLEAAAAKVDACTKGHRLQAFTLPKATHSVPLIVAWEPLIRQLSAEVADGRLPGRSGRDFHEAVAQLIVDVALRFRERLARTHPTTPLRGVGLTGGVFQNQLLYEQTLTRLAADGFEPLLPTRFPANDGGLALGQALLGRC